MFFSPRMIRNRRGESRLWFNGILYLVVAAMGSALLAQTQYQYSGSTFSFAQPPYTTAGRVNGSFSVAIPLQAYLSGANIANLLTDFSFSDGLQNRVPANTVVCNFTVTTDAAGHMVDWVINLRERNVAMGNQQQSLDSGSFGDLVGFGSAASAACSIISLSTAASSVVPGIWSDSLPPGTDTVYTFSGNNFTQLQPPYVTGQSLDGFFRVGNPLPCFASELEIGQALVDFSFTDGVQTRHPTNTELCRFEITTDGAGRIITWNLFLRETPAIPGNPQQSMASSPLGDQGGSGPAGGDPCGLISLDFVAQSFTAGDWTAPLMPGVSTDYNFVGAPYSSAQAPYLTSDRLEGFLRFANPLPPYLICSEMNFALDDYEFHDGAQSLDSANSTVCSLRVTTDANGQISKWRLNLREVPFTMGFPQGVIDSLTEGDQVGTAPADADACGGVSLSTSAENTAGGVWSDPLSDPAPAVYFYAGSAFSTADPPYKIGQRVGGRMVLPGALPANLPLTDIGEQLLYFQFEDPVQTRFPSDTSVCVFEVSTNAAGGIVQWQISLREPIFIIGADQESLDIFNLGLGHLDQSGNGPAAASVCGRMSLDRSASSLSEGAWFQFCPAQLAALADWPGTLDIVGLLALPCP